MIVIFVLNIILNIVLSVVPPSEIVHLSQELPVRIQISSVNINVPVKESPIIDGTWEVYKDSASFAKGTSFLNERHGNTVIFAHARDKLFKTLNDVELGDHVTVYGKNRLYSYKIVAAEKVSPYNVEALDAPADYRLTLLTCTGVNDEYRLLLRGKLVGESKYINEEVI